ncbi:MULTISPECIES: sugar ABC transporter substrate-binding protein [unclassified Paenibacillus]|uniref:ABC transporter substrate-binding protein n=1 Tax=unclassified Paenibacillus TaxID=185978 RepID=UPI0027886F1C|nr:MULTISPECIES: sugar ABC transporter substrate-binding protein [unclassified Paenibacillus]MDQ0899615.1 multiple sugar transport system substrate-binding protein [Paenibacillus sp. V4I7]MDQ0914432.1 multiple sugar transport system substrate-binding protein [Paenibacillus sp. V4I5]
MGAAVVKGWTTLFAGVMLLGTLAGCSGSGSSEITATPSGNTAAPNENVKSTEPPAKQITLQMIESLTSPERTKLLQDAIARFQKDNPNIKVELISPPFDQADNKIRTMLAAKQELDILEVRDLNIAEYVNNGYLEPLDTYASSWADSKTLSGTSKVVGSNNGKLYFIANALYQRQMFYRKDWFDAKGLAAPKTWEELVDSAKKLTDPKQNRYGFSFRGGPGANGNFDHMIYDYNDKVMNIDDAPFTKDGKTVYSTPEAKQALELYKKLYKEASPPDSINWGFQDQVQAFTSGVTGILLQDPDVIKVLQDKMDPKTLETAAMPLGPNGKSLVSTGAAGWGVTANSKSKNEAWKLISYLSSPKENTEFSKQIGTIPIHTSATADTFFQTGPYKTLLDMTSKADIFVNFTPPFKYPGNGSWGELSMKGQQSYLLDKKSTDDTLKEWDKFWLDQKAGMKK